MSEIVYLNGDLIPRNLASISILDYGFLYGFSLFETMRAYGGKVFRVDRHIKRLVGSAEILGMPIEGLDLKGPVMATVRANRLSEARIRLTVSRGEGSMVPDPGTCSRPTVLIMAQPYHPYPEEVYQKGFRAIVSTIRRNSQSPLSGIKSANYLESILTRQESRTTGVDEALCLNDKGLLAEGSMSNLFIVTNGVLRTPGAGSGVLPGITREAVLELAPALDIDALEQDIRLEELYQADEAFLTNSIVEIMPLTEVAGKPVGSGKAGPLTQRLMTAYKKLVVTELGIV